MKVYVLYTIANLINIVNSVQVVPTAPVVQVAHPYAIASLINSDIIATASIFPGAIVFKAVTITSNTKAILLNLLTQQNLVDLITSTHSEDFAGLLLDIPFVEYKNYSYAQAYYVRSASFFISNTLLSRNLGLLYDKKYNHDISKAFVESPEIL